MEPQWVNSVPPLPVHNKFFCLEIEGENPHIPTPQAEKPVTVAPTPLLPQSLCHIQNWEHKLPKKYVAASSPRSRSLVVKVEIQTTDTAEVMSGPVLIDSGATGDKSDADPELYIVRTILHQHHFQLSFTIASFHSQHSY